MISSRYSYIPKWISILAVCIVILHSQSSQAVTITSTNIDKDTWLMPGDKLSVTLSSQMESEDGSLRFFIERNDITQLFVQIRPGVYVYDASVITLPQGAQNLFIYHVSADGNWQQIGQYPFNVRSEMGFKESQITPSVNLSVNSELDNNYHGDAVRPEREKETNLTANISLSTQSSSDDFGVTSNINLLGVSNVQEALRYDEKGDDASNLDLSDYLLAVNTGKQVVSVGHISYGQNRYLLSGFGSRGVSYQSKFGESDSVDFSVASMNGTSIVGFDNLIGLSNSDHNIKAATLGYEFISNRPGALRAEFSYLDASILPETNFGEGQIPDAETSTGYGVRILGSNESQTLRAELTYASSKYNNPNDPLLSQGLDLVDVIEQTDDARLIVVTYDILRTELDEQGDFYSLTATVSHERVGPLFKSLGAFANADTETNNASLSMQLGKINAQLSNTLSEDNLKDIPTVLKTRTDNSSLNVSIPVKAMATPAGTPNNWLPDIQLAFNRTHQRGVNSPPSFDPTTHIPDQVNDTQDYGLNWNADKATFGYSYQISDQDNRQPGRANADFENKSHNLKLGYRFSDNFDIQTEISRAKAYDKENDLTTYDDNYLFGFNWHISKSLTLSANYSEFDGSDSQLNNQRNGYTGQTQLNWQFETPSLTGPGKKVPGQFFVNYASQRNRSIDNVFNFQSDAMNWSITAGLNLSLF